MDENGDLLIVNGQIQMVHDADLTAQKIKTVLGTQKGEWFLNWDEGINLDNILGKKRYASQTSGIDSQYIEEIRQLENENAENEAAEKRLNELLAKRLDGEI